MRKPDETSLRLTSDPRRAVEPVSPTLFRLFDELIAMAVKRSPRRRFDPLRHR
jgi:hypothetical protein